MAMGQPLGSPTAYEKGQRLYCESCGSEIEIINPCTCNPPGQVLKCCGRDMVPSSGAPGRIGVE
jgi:hypothetical protein